MVVGLAKNWLVLEVAAVGLGVVTAELEVAGVDYGVVAVGFAAPIVVLGAEAALPVVAVQSLIVLDCHHWRRRLAPLPCL